MMRARKLGEFLTAARVVVPFEPASYRDAVALLLDRLEGGQLVRDRGALERLIAEGEAHGIPTLGDRVLFPHYRTETAAALGLALGVGPEPFAFAPDEARQARIAVLVVAPREATGYYLKVVAALAHLFRDIEVVEAIEGARAAKEIAELPALREIELTPELVVRDVMRRDVIAVSPETPLTKIGRLMIEKGLRSLPVVGADGEVLGIVTDRELLEHFLPLIRAGAPPGVGAPREVLARDVMRKTVLGVSEDQSIADVTALMVDKDVVRVPVVTEGKLVGLLTRDDIVRKLLEPHVYGPGS